MLNPAQSAPPKGGTFGTVQVITLGTDTTLDSDGIVVVTGITTGDYYITLAVNNFNIHRVVTPSAGLPHAPIFSASLRKGDIVSVYQKNGYTGGTAVFYPYA